MFRYNRSAKCGKDVDKLSKDGGKASGKLVENKLYIHLKCKDGSLYTGWTNNLAKRLQAHNEGKGAKYTGSRRPVTLEYYEIYETKEEAMRREYEIKHMGRKKKLELIERKCQKEDKEKKPEEL